MTESEKAKPGSPRAPIEVLAAAREGLWGDELRALVIAAEVGLFKLDELEAESGLSVWVWRSGDVVHTSAFCGNRYGTPHQESLVAWLQERESCEVCPSCRERGGAGRSIPVEWTNTQDESAWGLIQGAALQVRTSGARLERTSGAHRLAAWLGELHHLHDGLNIGSSESLEALRVSAQTAMSALREQVEAKLAGESEQVRYWMAQEILSHALDELEWPEPFAALLSSCEPGVAGWAHPRHHLSMILFSAWRRSRGRELAGTGLDHDGATSLWLEMSKALGRVRTRLEQVRDEGADTALAALGRLEEQTRPGRVELAELDAVLTRELTAILESGSSERVWLLGVSRRSDGPLRSVLESHEAGRALGGARLATGAHTELALLDALGARWAATLGPAVRAELVAAPGLERERAVVIAQLWERGVADAALGSLATAELISRCVEP